MIGHDPDFDASDSKEINITTPPLQMQNSVYIHKRYDIVDPSVNSIGAHLSVKDSDSIEEPVGHHKQQHQNCKQGPE